MHVLAYKLLRKCRKDEVSDHSDHSDKKLHKGGPNELGHISGKLVFDRLHKILGERHGVSLCLDSHPDRTSWMEGAWRLPMFEHNQHR
jgi:hypothetical protein